MKLPNGERAFVPPEKLAGSLLSGTHPSGQSKARFFRSLGFSTDSPDLRAAQLRTIARTADSAVLSHAPHGQKYRLFGTIVTPGRQTARVQTVWIIETGNDRPRFVTAYPV